MVDDEDTPNSCSKQTAVSKLKDDSTKQQRHPNRAGWRGQKDRTTPLVPGTSSGQSGGGGDKERREQSSGSGLDVGKLHSILRGYGEYPAKYRSLATLLLLLYCHKNIYAMQNRCSCNLVDGKNSHSIALVVFSIFVQKLHMALPPLSS